jgi:hypothetical protein
MVCSATFYYGALNTNARKIRTGKLEETSTGKKNNETEMKKPAEMQPI